MNRDILGILVLKGVPILKLRLICKVFNKWIKSYNKYWFLTHFRRHSFDVLKRFNKIHHIKSTQIRLSEEKSMDFPFLSCLTLKAAKEIDEEMKRHSLYDVWMEEAKSFHFINTIYTVVYCRMQYLKGQEIICADSTHYSYFPVHFSMQIIDILPNNLLEFYDSNKNYFMKINEPSDRDQRFGSRDTF